MSEITIVVPTALRSFTGGEQRIVVEADTVAEALQRAEVNHAGLLARILAPDGALRPFVNLFVGSTSTRTLNGLATPTPDGTVLSIVPAVAGG